MTQNDDILNFLQQQVDWCKEQDEILAEIENKLKVMKALAEYRRAHELTYVEVQRLNEEMRRLQAEVNRLDQRLFKGMVH